MVDLADTTYDRWKKFDKDFCKFSAVEPKRSSRGDIHAMILLNELQPSDGDMIAAAEHDVIWFDIDVEKLMETITDQQIQELARCGISYDESLDSLSMFV